MSSVQLPNELLLEILHDRSINLADQLNFWHAAKGNQRLTNLINLLIRPCINISRPLQSPRGFTPTLEEEYTLYDALRADNDGLRSLTIRTVGLQLCNVIAMISSLPHLKLVRVQAAFRRPGPRFRTDRTEEEEEICGNLFKGIEKPMTTGTTSTLHNA
ncbi:hypothetical protein MNV49_000494 [Pseudohyphozyma bogoriensis]|nr:hypothetical protein MNV49_000494 [Pseudohyphozyma bogoriensis]